MTDNICDTRRYFCKLFTDNAFVKNNLYILELTLRNEAFYEVPIMGNKSLFESLRITDNGIVEMYNYTKVVDNEEFISLCTDYAEIPVGRNLQTTWQRDNVSRIANKIKMFYSVERGIPISINPETLETNVEVVAKANVAALTRLNNVVNDNLLIKHINAM